MSRNNDNSKKSSTILIQKFIFYFGIFMIINSLILSLRHHESVLRVVEHQHTKQDELEIVSVLLNDTTTDDTTINNNNNNNHNKTNDENNSNNNNDNLNISDSFVTTSTSNNNNVNEEEETSSNKNIDSTGYKNGMIRQYSYNNAWIIQNGCIMTVVMLDPKLSSSVFFALESVADNVHPINETCILIQTSICRIQKEYKLEETSSSYDIALNLLTEIIYNSSKPLFRGLIELGNVRVTILNHTKYQTKNCEDFRSVNAPFFNIDYWSDHYYIDSDGNKVIMNQNSNSTVSAVRINNDADIQITTSDDMNQSLVLNGEFIAHQDSDFILVIQNDAVLCHGLDVYSWNQFPYVGAPWNKKTFCNKFKQHWHGWHTLANGYNESISTIPDYPSDTCNDPDVAPLGNGGLSLRSRYWMREAIRYCPQVNYSGLSEEEIQNATCLHYDIRFDSQEDVYYGMLLRGIFLNRKNITSHKMPTILEAALFSSEGRYFTDHYNDFEWSSNYSDEVLVKQLWWGGENITRYNNNDNNDSLSYHEGWERYQRMKAIWIQSNFVKPIIPIGYHAIHRFDLRGFPPAYHHFVQECPYIIGIIPANFKIPPEPVTEINASIDMVKVNSHRLIQMDAIRNRTSLSVFRLFQDVYSRSIGSNMNDILNSTIIDSSSSMIRKKNNRSSIIRTLANYYEHNDICYGCLYETYDPKYKSKTCFMALNELMSIQQQTKMSFMDALINVSYTHPNYCHRCHPIHCQQEQEQEQQEQEGGGSVKNKKHEKKYYRIDDIMTNSYMIHDARTYRLLDPPPSNSAGVQTSGRGIHKDHRIPWTTFNNSSQITHYLSNPDNLYPYRKYFYEYNPSIILLPIHQRPTKDSIYLMSFRVSTANGCLLEDDKWRLFNSYIDGSKNKDEDYLGLAILNENLEIISQTVVNFMVVAKFKNNFQDIRLFVLRDQIYIASYHLINPIWLVPPSSTEHNDITDKVYQVDGHNSTFEESTIILSYYYPDALNINTTRTDEKGSDYTNTTYKNTSMMKVYVRKVRSCLTWANAQYGGKNINYFVDKNDRIIVEIYPGSSKELLNVNQSCRRKSRKDVSNNFLLESSNQTNGIYPVKSYGTSDEFQMIQQNIDFKPYSNERGSICCINVQDPNNNHRNLLLGISHTKISSKNQKIPRNMTYNYYSTFYVMEDTEPYNVIARSGFFCLGYPTDLLNETKRTTSSSSTTQQEQQQMSFDDDLFLVYKYPLLYQDPLIVGNDTYTKCPKIHFITGMTEQYNNSNNIILSYGIDDCISRIVVIEKSKILQLLFHPHDDLLLLHQNINSN